MAMRKPEHILSPKIEVNGGRKTPAFIVSGNGSRIILLRNVYSVKTSDCSLAPLSPWVRSCRLGSWTNPLDWRFCCLWREHRARKNPAPMTSQTAVDSVCLLYKQSRKTSISSGYYLGQVRRWQLSQPFNRVIWRKGQSRSHR